MPGLRVTTERKDHEWSQFTYDQWIRHPVALQALDRLVSMRDREAVQAVY